MVPVLTAALGHGVVAGFTGRAGGTSAGGYAGLDLGQHVGDDPLAVAGNRRRVAAWAGGPVVFARQVHGTRCAVLPGAGDPSPDPFLGDLGEDDGGYDALVVTAPGHPIGVLVADCVPVLLADPVAGVAAVAHAGRPGLLAGVLESVVRAMTEAGAQAERVRAVLGPSAGPCCYEVPSAMRDDAAARIPATSASTTWGTPSLDLRAGCRQILRTLGVGDVTSVGGCTVEDDRFYSFRRSPVTGRFAGVVMMVG
ncbi:MAG: purine-nucleoside/S-methyl-5-thioadenosine phosphorylase / adenosine deaminase [Actinomycetota bacterium]|nr:purine-nucleoside/S-methyl-5-thioadenosine phosphorylase / adenosine deaminase [Actinomycetota bacterium]